MTTATRTLEEIRAEILQDEQKAKFLARIERGEKIEPPIGCPMSTACSCSA